jgi:hypothetical protein
MLAGGDDFQQAEGAGPGAGAPGALEAPHESEQSLHHQRNIALARSHDPIVV